MQKRSTKGTKKKGPWENLTKKRQLPPRATGGGRRPGAGTTNGKTLSPSKEHAKKNQAKGGNKKKENGRMVYPGLSQGGRGYRDSNHMGGKKSRERLPEIVLAGIGESKG